MNRDMLAALDPAPKRELSPAERHRQDQLLTSILADAAPVERRRPVRRIAIGGALVAGMAAAVVLGPVAYHMIRGNPNILSAAAIGSWTGTPTRLTADSVARQWCEHHATGDQNATGPFTVSNADRRGEVTSMILTRGQDITLCLVGSDEAGLTEAIDPVTKLAANAIDLDTAGGHGDGVTGFNYAEGSAGADVTSVTLHEGSRTIDALIDHGRWTAWWPADPPTGLLGGDVTITMKDGSVRSVPAQSLFH
ncbi:hypothetical protein [Kutzneria chonburiensis]|uniref:Uncharacterized protein n=1 Tax=Kutzneria chonburiensis TaxID=1483604 RepID=A0ABV6MKT2_9PSEU|nr:hypothetical protein [Kutzneria chonburiensis]